MAERELVATSSALIRTFRFGHRKLCIKHDDTVLEGFKIAQRSLKEYRRGGAEYWPRSEQNYAISRPIGFTLGLRHNVAPGRGQNIPTRRPDHHNLLIHRQRVFDVDDLLRPVTRNPYNLPISLTSNRRFIHST
ncbi:uncharacterized protein LOC143207238 [Lasioglossum baleicum]|uniref:uncharacterized protein LOC143207238 n=1 Tax=Lasioglossum baleicum TaxID=434251 RepID=UPI003FCD1DBE